MSSIAGKPLVQDKINSNEQLNQQVSIEHNGKYVRKSLLDVSWQVFIISQFTVINPAPDKFLCQIQHPKHLKCICEKLCSNFLSSNGVTRFLNFNSHATFHGLQ